jgi:hypothetical protein
MPGRTKDEIGALDTIISKTWWLLLTGDYKPRQKPQRIKTIMASIVGRIYWLRSPQSQAIQASSSYLFGGFTWPANGIHPDQHSYLFRFSFLPRVPCN